MIQYLYSKTTRGFYVVGMNPDIPPDAEPISEEERQEILAGQANAEAPSAEQAALIAAEWIQDHILDATARDMGYDDIKTAVTYADEPAVPKFQNDGIALRRWRSLVWAKAYEILDDVKAGERMQPSAEELLSELPPFE